MNHGNQFECPLEEFPSGGQLMLNPSKHVGTTVFVHSHLLLANVQKTLPGFLFPMESQEASGSQTIT
jgi:hypothetical protein